MPKLTPKKFEENRLHILAAAETCFMRQGFQKASMRDIAEEAGLSLGNIYHYFKNKEALVAGFVSETNKELIDSLELVLDSNNPKKVLKQILGYYVKEMVKPFVLAMHTEILAEALRNSKVKQIIQNQTPDAVDRLRDILQQCVDDKKIKLPVGASYTANTIEAIADNTASASLIKKGYSARKAIKEVEALLDILIIEVE